MSTLKKEELYRRGYNFIVYLEGKQIPFQRVSGLADQGSLKHCGKAAATVWCTALRIRRISSGQ